MEKKPTRGRRKETGRGSGFPAKRSKPIELEVQAPRDEFGELVLRRRDVHSGTTLRASTVDWNRAVKGFMWDNGTEVDRFRERVPLPNCVSHWRRRVVDPSKPKIR